MKILGILFFLWSTCAAGSLATAPVGPAEREKPPTGNQVAQTTWPIGAERIAVEVDLRFERIGQDDNGTGERNHFRISAGTRTPRPFGVTIRISADRCEVDGQARILRTDANWHRWQFEIDARQRTVAVLRDGKPISLQRAGSQQPDGIRLGTAGDSVVEVRTLRTEALPNEYHATALRPLPAGTNPGIGEWTHWRGDARNTGISHLRGRITEPSVLWRHPLGKMAPAPVFHDLDQDGTLETLIAHGGRLAAYTGKGRKLWDIAALAAVVWGVHDLRADNQPGLVVTAGNPSRLQVLEPTSGKVIYDCPKFPKAGVAGVRIAKLDPKHRGLQAVVWSAQHEVGFTVGFEHGIDKGRVLWTFDWKTTNFTPIVALADMDQDSDLDLVLTTYDRTFVFDGATGRRRIDYSWPSGRNYGAMVVKDIDRDGYPDIVVLADFLREHVAVLKNVRGKGLAMLWDRFLEQDYPEDKRSLVVLTESVDDFDGDGQTEIAVSQWDQRWVTETIDATTGKTKQVFPNTVLAGAGPLFPRHPPVLFLRPATQRTIDADSVIEIVSLQGADPRKVGELPRGHLLDQSLDPNFPLNVGSTHKILTQVLRNRPDTPDGQGVAVAVSTPPGIRFLVGDSDLSLKTVWQASPPAGWEPPVIASVARPRRTSLLMQHERSGRALDFIRQPIGGSASLVSSDSDGILRFSASDGKTEGLIRTANGPISVPIVAQLSRNTTPSILVFDANGDLQCLRSPQGSPPKLAWKRKGSGSVPRMVPYIDTYGAPVVSTLESSTTPLVLMAIPPRDLVALDSEGKERKRWAFPSPPLQWSTGLLDPIAGQDLLVTYATGPFLQVETTARAGSDGAVLWTREFGNGPLGVADLNGDGFDDVVLRDLFERRVVDGRNGREILPSGQWAGYHTPAILDMQGQGAPPGIAWLGGMYSVLAESPIGNQRWWRPANSSLRDFGTGPGAVADTDGDGRAEIGLITSGQLYNWPKFFRVDGPDKDFLCYDALTGKMRWRVPIGATTAGVVAADVDGDGRLDFVFGTEDGRLIAIRGGNQPGNRILWEMAFPFAVGMPVPADIHGNGELTLLVSCADGYLYAIGGKGIGDPPPDGSNRGSRRPTDARRR